MSASRPVRPETETPGFPGISFGRGADGMPVALVGDTAFAMAMARDDRHYLVTAWRLARPMGEWTRDDFYGHSGELADEAAFRARVLENAEHQRERNRKVHPMLRSAGGWYEEDAAWAIVAITFPHLFTAFERRCAERTVKDSWPDAWEAISGTILQPGESCEKDRRLFEREHADHWVVASAITSNHEPGFVEVVATLGGKRGAGTEERRYLVPSAEYSIGRFGFVIDEARHQVYGGPSDFVGWR